MRETQRELTPFSLPNTFSGSSEWNLLGANSRVSSFIADCQGLSTLRAALANFLEAICPNLPGSCAHHPLPRPGPRLGFAEEPARGPALCGGASLVSPSYPNPQTPASEAFGLAAVDLPSGMGCVPRPPAESARPVRPSPGWRGPEPGGPGSSKGQRGNPWSGVEGERLENSFFLMN